MSAVDLNDQNVSELSYQLEVEVVLDLEDRIPRGCWKPGCRSPAGLFRGVSECQRPQESEEIGCMAIAGGPQQDHKQGLHG